jgi:hypothetical protein
VTNEGRMSRGWRLTRVAWRVLISDRTACTLAAMQIVSSACLLAATAWLTGWLHHPGQRSRLYIGALIAYWPSMLISTFIGVALAAAVLARLDGRHLSLRQALAVPCRRFGQVLLWSLLATGVGVLLQEVISRIPFGGRIVSALAGVAWSLGTLFVIPILAIDGCRSDECVRRSVKLIKQRWGEGVTGGVVITSWTVFVAIPLGVLVAIIVGATRSRTAGWLVFLVGISALGSISWVVTRVFSVALYRFATTGQTPAPFSQQDIERPFTKRRRLFRRG